MNIQARIAMERKLVTHLCKTMREHGWVPIKVDDGGEMVWCVTDEDVLDVVFSVDESTIHFKKGGVRHGAYIVLGNDGYDAICDYSYSEDEDDDFDEIMKKYVDPYAEQLENGEV